MSKTEAGFTLVEMLVGLLVLSFAALTLSTTLSSAFSSFNKVRTVNQDILDTQHLSHMLSEVGRTYFYQSIETTPNNKTRVRFKPDSELLTQNGSPSLLVLKQVNRPDHILWESPNPMELSVERLTIPANERQRRLVSSRPHIVVKTLIDDVWAVKAKAPLIVSEDAGCQYDIVGRRCR